MFSTADEQNGFKLLNSRLTVSFFFEVNMNLKEKKKLYLK